MLKNRIANEMFRSALYSVRSMYILLFIQRFVPVKSEIQGQTAAVSRMANLVANT